MLKRIIFGCVMVFAIFLQTGCSSNKGNDYAHAPTSAQIDHYMSKHGIKPLATKTINNEFTVLLKDNSAITLYCDQSNNLIDNHMLWGSENRSVTLGGVATGIPYVILIINDEKILENGDKILVVFNDNVRVSENVSDKKAHIIQYPTSTVTTKSYVKVYIKDKNSNIIYES